jgi:hypothetical protein
MLDLLLLLVPLAVAGGLVSWLAAWRAAPSGNRRPPQSARRTS